MTFTIKWPAKSASGVRPRYLPAAALSAYQLPGFTNVNLTGITAAKDGSLWFGETALGAIGHLVY